MMIRLIYTTLFYMALPFVWLRLLWRSRRDKNYAKRWSERLGYVPEAIKNHLNSECIWWHCVSVGETLAALPLIKKLIQQYPHTPVLVTGMTPSGSEQIQKQLGSTVYHMYAPYDLPHLWKRFFKHIKPKILIIMETELWPNMLASCHARKIPMILINARLSAKSAKGYGRGGNFIKVMLNYLNIIAVQNEVDGNRFLKLGLAPDKLHVTGTVKFDLTISAELIQKAKELREKWDSKRPVFIAASTHSGEDEIILQAFQKIYDGNPEVLLFLVPRHPERAGEIIELCREYDFTYCRRSLGEIPSIHTQVFIGDTIGELLLFYAVSDIAFVGGSLVEKGGHNVLEPAALGIPVITGPFMYNFAQIDKLLSDSEAIIKVKNADSLANAVLGLLNDEKKRQAVGKRGEGVIAKNRGASEKQLNLIAKLLEKSAVKEIKKDSQKTSKKALILVDLQNDFMPGGALGVERGDEVIPVANEMQKHFDLIIATKDWHPENHTSFVNLWPVHCVQNSDGAKLVDSLNTEKIQKVVHKGTNVDIDSYSAFFDNEHQQKTELDDYLKSLGVTEIYLMGLMTNYCIKYSALDARELGYTVNVIEDGCRGAGDVAAVFDEMRRAGARIVKSKDLVG